MNSQNYICFTLGAALEKAIELENSIFADFWSSLQAVENVHAQNVLRETALAKLEQKHTLEQALLLGTLDGLDLHAAVPTMKLDQHYGSHKLAAGADTRDAMSYAIHLVTESVTFYQGMSKACAGAPMSEMFKRLGDEQTGLLQKLEDSYEAHFLTEN